MSDDERAEDIVRAFRLIHDIQADTPGAPEALSTLAGHARASGWDDVERACVFGDAVRLWIAGDSASAKSVGKLIEMSTAAGDDVMLALGLALRSEQGFAGTDLIGSAATDADLARAVVLLERETGGRPCERITAHTACAVALGHRWLFELSHEQYELALAIGGGEPAGTVDFLLAPIRFNLAEEQVSWASKLYELGDERGVLELWGSWNQAVAATGDYAMTEGWRSELEALGLVLRGIAGHDAASEAAGRLAWLDGLDTQGRTGGLLKLAVAVDAARQPIDDDPRTGSPMVAIEAAVRSLSPAVHPFMYDLSLFLAASVESRSGAGAGLRYARRTLEEQWTKREAALRAMRAHITSVRVSSERDTLSRHALLDDLTGIANRRALGEFLAELTHRGDTRCALVLFDVDSFKAVNDHHGHLAGDRLLVRIAHVLARGIRSSDLAVRLGGDEFAVLLASTGTRAAAARATALVRALDDEPLGDITEGLVLEVSAGVACGPPQAIMDIWSAADGALYAAKAAGGHTVRAARAAVA